MNRGSKWRWGSLPWVLEGIRGELIKTDKQVLQSNSNNRTRGVGELGDSSGWDIEDKVGKA